ncbi:MAG: aminotransferase class III-fold pyridoxal phosphate-dependent enzyme, partial [Pseudomonadota bacterium]
SSENPDGWFAHGFTCAGHPVGCAVALKNIEIMEREDICGNVREVGDYFEGRLHELAELPIVGDVRGKRMMMCVEYVADKQTRAHIPHEVNISKRISNLCETRGLLVRPMGHLDVMSPPLTMTREDADFLVDTIRGAVVEVTDELVREGVI